MTKHVPPEVADAAQRMADAVNLHVHARLAAGGDAPPGYVAIRLSDGRDPDGVMYDTRAAIFRHHPFDKYLFPVKVGMETMPLREAIIVLQMARMAFSRGVVFSEEEVISPHRSELLTGLIPNTLRGLK